MGSLHNTIMNLLVVVTLLVPFVCGDGGHHHHTQAPQLVDPVDLITHHIVGHMWTSMDYNKDGTFGRDDLDHFIHSYDTDRNGHVSRLEFLAHWNKDDPQLSMVGEGLMMEMDSNQDHVIDSKDLDEFHNRIDTDQNGTVDKAEFEAYFQQLLTLLYALSLHQTPSLG